MIASLATERQFTLIEDDSIASGAAPDRPHRGPTLVRMRLPLSLNERASFDEYLRRLEHGPVRLERAHASSVRALWRALLRDVRGLPMPSAGPSADGFQLSWSLRSEVIEIDVLPDGRLHWYALDRATRRSEGSEEPCVGVPRALMARLERIARR